MLQLLAKYYIEITYILCAILGGVMHWIKKFLNKETDAKLLEWYGRHNVAATIYTFTIFFFAIVGSLAADIINSQTGFWAAMYTGFVTGFAIDSGFNRDMRDVHRDLVETKTSMNDFFDKDGNRRSGSSRIGGSSRGGYSRDVSYDRDDSDDKNTRDDGRDDRTPSRNLTVEERRAQLRKKLKP